MAYINGGPLLWVLFKMVSLVLSVDDGEKS